MQKVTLTVLIPLDTAVLLAHSTHGNYEYYFSNTDLADLTPDQRVWLANDMCNRTEGYHANRRKYVSLTSGPLTVASETWGDILAALVERFDREQLKAQVESAKKAAKRALYLIECDKILQLDTWQAINNCGEPCLIDTPYASDDTDPRITDRLVVERKIRDDHANRRRAAQDQMTKDKHLRVAQAKKDADHAMRAYALEIPSLARAAKEDYPVFNASWQHVLDQIAEIDDGKIDSDPDLEDRPAPSEFAFALHDKIGRELTKVRLPACIGVTLKRIQRVSTMCTNDCEESYGSGCGCEHYTAVVMRVEIKAYDKKSYVIFRAETKVKV